MVQEFIFLSVGWSFTQWKLQQHYTKIESVALQVEISAPVLGEEVVK